MIDLPENLSDAALTERLAVVLENSTLARFVADPEDVARELLPEVRRIVVDTLLHVVHALSGSDGCQDFPFDLALEIDTEHLHSRLAAESRARELREHEAAERAKRARVLAALRVLTGEAP